MNKQHLFSIGLYILATYFFPIKAMEKSIASNNELLTYKYKLDRALAKEEVKFLAYLGRFALSWISPKEILAIKNFTDDEIALFATNLAENNTLRDRVSDFCCVSIVSSTDEDYILLRPFIVGCIVKIHYYKPYPLDIYKSKLESCTFIDEYKKISNLASLSLKSEQIIIFVNEVKKLNEADILRLFEKALHEPQFSNYLSALIEGARKLKFDDDIKHIIAGFKVKFASSSKQAGQAFLQKLHNQDLFKWDTQEPKEQPKKQEPQAQDSSYCTLL